MKTPELLEKAAFAAGLEFRFRSRTPAGLFCLIPLPKGGASWGFWNPLKDDSQALWLAIRIQASVSVDISLGVRVVALGVCGQRRVDVLEPLTEDLAATGRRALVRAAAAVGATMTPASKPLLQQGGDSSHLC